MKHRYRVCSAGWRWGGFSARPARCDTFPPSSPESLQTWIRPAHSWLTHRGTYKGGKIRRWLCECALKYSRNNQIKLILYNEAAMTTIFQTHLRKSLDMYCISKTIRLHNILYMWQYNCLVTHAMYNCKKKRRGKRRSFAKFEQRKQGRTTVAT